MRAISPNGTAITGTLERIAGNALLDEGSFERQPDGRLSYEHAGETEIFWSEQVTVERDGKTVFLDEHGAEWTEDDITLVSDDDEAITIGDAGGNAGAADPRADHPKF